MKSMPFTLLAVAFLLPVVCFGCSGDFGAGPPVREDSAIADPSSAREPLADANGRKQGQDGLAADKGKLAGGGEIEEKRNAPPAERKIISTADIRLTVADFIKAEQELDQLVQTHKGYFAQADASGSAGATRQGTWKVRMQASKAREFGEAVKKLGELVRYTSDAKEVTEEYYDLQIRVKNKEAELETLRKIYEKAGDKIEYVLSVQHELNRAQRELEQMKGRQRVLDDLIDLTTLTVHMQERGTFTPTEPTTFGNTLAQTFSGSIDLLIGLGKAVVVVAVAITPWLPLLAVISALIWLATRRHRIATPSVVVSPAADVKPN